MHRRLTPPDVVNCYDLGVHDNERDVLRNVTIISWICTLAPIVLLALLGTMALHVRLALGHWPTPMSDDYDSALLGFEWLGLMLWFLFAVFAAPPIWIAGVIVGWSERRMRTMFGLQVLAFAAGWALVYGVFAWNPAGFAEWLLD
jgi:hypothetical protein